MVSSEHSVDLARRLPNSQVIIYPDLGHGGSSSLTGEFVPALVSFLDEAAAHAKGRCHDEPQVCTQLHLLPTAQ